LRKQENNCFYRSANCGSKKTTVFTHSQNCGSRKITVVINPQNCGSRKITVFINPQIAEAGKQLFLSFFAEADVLLQSQSNGL
jgi:hypothetical protein